MADITIHVDNYQDDAQRQRLLSRLNLMNGVSAVTAKDKHPKLFVVQYDPSLTSSEALLGTVKEEGLRGELIGL